MSRSLGKWLGRVALFSGSVLLVAGLGEGIARLAIEDAPRVSTLTPEQRRRLPVYRGLTNIVRPNLDGQHRGVAFRTNSRGVRGPEYAIPKPHGVRRIGVVGDSVTMGWGVDEGRAYPAVVQRILSNDRPGVRWEVLNLGMAGYAAPEIMRRLERMDAHYDFDLLVYGFTSNDIEGPAFVREAVSRTDEGIHVRVSRALRSPSYLWRLIWPRWISLSERLFPTPGSHSAQLVYNYLENPSAWIDFATSLDQLARHSRRGKRCTVVLLHTALSELNALHPYQPVYEKVALAARKRGLFAVPSFHAFAGLYEPNLWIDYFDPHPNATAHAKLAELLAEAVLDLPKSCWQRRGSS